MSRQPPSPQAARQAGWQPIPGVRYRRFRWTLGGPRMQWITGMESARTAAQLAIGMRQLDAVLQVGFCLSFFFVGRVLQVHVRVGVGTFWWVCST